MKRLKVCSSFNASDLAGATVGMSAADSDTEFSELEVHIPVSQSDGAIPVKIDAHQPLDGNEALQLMRNAQTKHAACISTCMHACSSSATTKRHSISVQLGIG